MPWPYSKDLRLAAETGGAFVLTPAKTGAAPMWIFGAGFVLVSIKLLLDPFDRTYGFVFAAIGVIFLWVAVRRTTRQRGESLSIDFSARTCTLARSKSAPGETQPLDALRIQGLEFTPGVEVTAKGCKPGGVATVTFVFGDHEPVIVFESADHAAALARFESLAKKLALPATLFEWNADVSELNPRPLPGEPK
jgi:hypothetical protein